MNIKLSVADKKHFSYAEEICNLMEKAAKKRGTDAEIMLEHQ
ncbi:hypothetical protein [Fodinibius sp.]|nr:hypothetical protein [Fodinibius sp.]MDZ7657868.1 hypothetical protein [Fodinibius sp.]